MEAAIDTNVENVTITSANPRLPTELLDGLANDRPHDITARFSLPKAAANPMPAMVIVHGSGGFGSRGLAYERLLNAAGIATLRTNSFAPRGVQNTVGNQAAVTSTTMVADAFSALKFLAADPRIDARRIGIMGFSKGGSVAQATAFEPFRAAAVGDDLAFALHLPFYRACMLDVDMPLTGAPVRELVGGADDYTGVDGCVRYAQTRKDQGDDYDIVVYPGAHHGFNADYGPRPCSECISYVACDLVLRADGSVYDRSQGLEYGRETHRKIMGACTKRGVMVGGNPKAATQASEFVLAFTRQVFNITP